MKKEYLITISVALFILGYVIDFFGGLIPLSLRNPFDLLQREMISTYPFTTVSIAFKTLALFIAMLLFLNMIEQKYLAKGAFLLFLAALMELYSVQQIATSSTNLPMVWIVAISYSGVLLLFLGLIHLTIGIIKKIHRSITSLPYDNVMEDTPPEDL